MVDLKKKKNQAILSKRCFLTDDFCASYVREKKRKEKKFDLLQQSDGAAGGSSLEFQMQKSFILKVSRRRHLSAGGSWICRSVSCFF